MAIKLVEFGLVGNRSGLAVGGFWAAKLFTVIAEFKLLTDGEIIAFFLFEEKKTTNSTTTTKWKFQIQKFNFNISHTNFERKNKFQNNSLMG